MKRNNNKLIEQLDQLCEDKPTFFTIEETTVLTNFSSYKIEANSEEEALAKYQSLCAKNWSKLAKCQLEHREDQQETVIIKQRKERVYA